MTAPPPSSRPRRPVWLLLVVLLAAACAGTGPAARADHSPEDAGPSRRGPARRLVPGTVPAPSDVVPAPLAASPADALPDPGVEPGDCRVVTYTPPGAAEAEVGELCRPAGAQRDVAVIVVHGGAGIGGTRLGLRPWAERYRREGYVTFLPDYHLFTPGSKERPVFPRPEQNVKAAVQYVRGVAGALGVRPDRIALQGHSAGARIGAVAFTTPDDDWFAGRELHDGISCAIDAFIGFYHPYDGTMQFSDQYFGGSPSNHDRAARERLERADSLRRADDASGPALFITGSRDWDLITDQQAAFAKALRAEGHLARTVVIAGGGHGFDEGDGSKLPRLGEQAATHTLAFLTEVFPPD